MRIKYIQQHFPNNHPTVLGNPRAILAWRGFQSMPTLLFLLHVYFPKRISSLIDVDRTLLKKKIDLIALLRFTNKNQTSRWNDVHKIKRPQDSSIPGMSMTFNPVDIREHDNTFQYDSIIGSQLSRKWIDVFRIRVRDQFYESKMVKLISIFPEYYKTICSLWRFLLL